MTSPLSPSLLASLRSQSFSLNLQTLQRVDSSISSIVHTASHAVLYDFNFDTQQWDKTDTEGPFFIVQRVSSPYFMLFLLNRKNPQNFQQALLSGSEYETQENYLFYSIQDKVSGLWFYEKKEASEALAVIQSLVENLKDPLYQPSLEPQGDQGENKKINKGKKNPANQGKNLAISTSKPLHPKAPPPPVEFQSGIESTDKRALEARLNDFMSQFKASDQKHDKIHQEAVKKQQKPTAAKENQSIPVPQPTAPTAPAPQPVAPAPVLLNPAHFAGPPQQNNQIMGASAYPTMNAPAPLPYPGAIQHNFPLPPHAFQQPPGPPAFPHFPQFAPATGQAPPQFPYGSPAPAGPSFPGFAPPAATSTPTPSQTKAAAIRAALKAANKPTNAPAAQPAAPLQPQNPADPTIHPLLSQMFASAAQQNAAVQTPQPSQPQQILQSQQPQPSQPAYPPAIPGPPNNNHTVPASSGFTPAVSQFFQSAAASPAPPAQVPSVGPSPPPAVPRPPPGLSKDQFRLYLLSLLNDPAYVDFSYWKYQTGQQIPY